MTGMLRSKYPLQVGGVLDRWKSESVLIIRSSIALASLTSVASLNAVPKTPKLNGILLKECTEAGTVMIG